MECRAAYRTDGPAELAPVGETEFVAAEARAQRRADRAASSVMPTCGCANLDEILDAHIDAGGGLFRGIRDALSRAEPSDGLMIPGGAPAGLFEDPAFRAGVARLGARGLTYDSLALPLPEPRVPRARARRARTRRWSSTTSARRSASGRTPISATPSSTDWKRDIADIARCENVVAKLGGLAMPDNGFGWHIADRPPTSDEFVAAQGRYYLHMIECFGADRCMFESNFPVDRMSLSYRVLWNGLKKIAQRLFRPTNATRCSPAPRPRVYGC